MDKARTYVKEAKEVRRHQEAEAARMENDRTARIARVAKKSR